MEEKWGRVRVWLLLDLILIVVQIQKKPAYSAAESVLRADQGSALEADTRALGSFLAGLQAAPRVSWPSNVSACDWQGVSCSNGAGRRVEGLRLPGVGLRGRIPDGVLSSLSELRFLSLHSNKLSGPLPSDLSNCTELRTLYLHDNELSGRLPPLSALPPLIRLNLAHNNFSGSIPPSYARLRRLGSLYLQNNSISGGLPDFLSFLPNLTQFSVAYNLLNGSLPALLQNRFGLAAFQGNDFCGKPFFALCANASIAGAPPSPAAKLPPSPTSKRLSRGYIAALIAGGAAVALFLLTCAIAWCIRRRGRGDRGKYGAEAGGIAAASKGWEGSGQSAWKGEEYSSGGAEVMERNKLVFFEGGGAAAAGSRFDMEDLLRASAEVLGKGSVGTAYKAVLDEGTTVVVKRLKEVTAGRREFEQQMASLGSFRHRHLVQLLAYYYAKDEKLILSEYMPLGSLSALLHGNRGSTRTPLDWDTRLRIATGAAKGIAFLHEQGGGNKFIHGNIKASNVLLTRNYDARVSDFCLAPLFGSSPAASRIAGGYRAPEVLETRRISAEADVYSYGVVLLELLTGKAPMQASSSNEGIDLPRWVQSVVREEWTAEVFDVDLLRHDNIEEEMVQILQVAMACVATPPGQRPTMPQVVRMIEDVRAFETEDSTNRQSSSDKSKDSNGRTPQRTQPSTPATTTP